VAHGDGGIHEAATSGGGDTVAYIAQFRLGGQGEPQKAHASFAMTAESHWSGPTPRRSAGADSPHGLKGRV